jgi:hypothetical protein
MGALRVDTTHGAILASSVPFFVLFSLRRQGQEFESRVRSPRVRYGRRVDEAGRRGGYMALLEYGAVTCDVV